MLAHAEIIVRAPDGDIAHSAAIVADSTGELARLAFQVGEDTVIAFLLEVGQPLLEEVLEIHTVHSRHHMLFFACVLQQSCIIGQTAEP